MTLYPAGTDEEARTSSDAFTGDIVIAEQVWQSLELQRRSGDMPTFGYKFTHTSPYVPIASHLVEVPFVFGTLTPQFVVGGKALPTETDRLLSATIMSYWVNFAAKGDPNGPGLPESPAYDGRGKLQVFGGDVGPKPDTQAERFRFLANHRAKGVFPASWRQLVD